MKNTIYSFFRAFYPLDYLRMLYGLCFDWHAYPVAKGRRTREIVWEQTVFLLAALNVAVGGLAWSLGAQIIPEAMFFGAILGLGMAALIVGGYRGSEWALPSSVGGTFHLALSLVMSITCGVGFDTTADRLIAMTLWVSLAVAMKGAREGGPHAVACLVFGLAGMTFTQMMNVSERGEGAVFFVAFFMFFACLIIYGIGSFTISRSVRINFCLDIIVLIVFFPSSYLLSPYLFVAVFAGMIVYTRLPLWLLEIVWAVSIMHTYGRRQTISGRFVFALRLAYFDRQMILPLPGEASALKRLALLDYDAALRELVQLLCYNLVTRLNRQIYEEQIARQPRVTLADVEAVIGTAEFYNDSNAYFGGVWRQAEMSEPTGQTLILQALCRSLLSVAEIIEQTGLSGEQARAALETLESHDVIVQHDRKYTYTIELMRDWVAHRQEPHHESIP